ncbi:SMI1/KNR4 family protein [Aquimarina sp. TRL1]|uniref:SMI1/KNR4 family protein n=1 Tax=Aquimarina sp. (strain TRL1) TaxID=2736252 RepID=UPI001589ECAA|nr:SMI1/KNR4 family protein [Aquimarina sp. TRL1]QKX07326.1 SMI1/KNR4 family protein [Aquimarina sp. TRL1]
MNSIVKTYIKGLKNAYFDNKGQKDWEHFEKVISGATQENVAMLRQMYPEISNALIGLLEYVDGTYWRTYGETEITFFMLGSDVYEYPYYLLSSNEIIENKNQAQEYYADYIEERYEGIVIDEKITNEADKMNWLHFSNCMNNGGTSQLFIDFSPSEKGKKGQVIRFLHDPDEFKVIADSFEEYLKKLMDNTYNFIHEDSMEY